MAVALVDEGSEGACLTHLNPSLMKYHISHTKEKPAMDVIFVQMDEPSAPFGAKFVSDISIDGGSSHCHRDP